MRVKTGLVEGGVLVANSGYSFSSLLSVTKRPGRSAYRGKVIIMAEPEQEEVEEEVAEEEVEETEQEDEEAETV